MKVEPQKEHAWLQKLVGTWTYEGTCAAGPGNPESKSTGTETVRPLGDVWVVGEGQGTMPDGGPARMLITLGFDPQTRRFVGTWVGSMMTHLWVYEGELDAAGRVLTLNAEGPAMCQGGGMAKYQDIIEIVSDGHRTLTSRLQGEDGKWTAFMTMHFRRTG